MCSEKEAEEECPGEWLQPFWMTCQAPASFLWGPDVSPAVECHKIALCSFYLSCCDGFSSLQPSELY